MAADEMTTVARPPVLPYAARLPAAEFSDRRHAAMICVAVGAFLVTLVIFDQTQFERPGILAIANLLVGFIVPVWMWKSRPGSVHWAAIVVFALVMCVIAFFPMFLVALAGSSC